MAESSDGESRQSALWRLCYALLAALLAALVLAFWVGRSVSPPNAMAFSVAHFGLTALGSAFLGAVVGCASLVLSPRQPYGLLALRRGQASESGREAAQLAWWLVTPWLVLIWAVVLAKVDLGLMASSAALPAVGAAAAALAAAAVVGSVAVGASLAAGVGRIRILRAYPLLSFAGSTLFALSVALLLIARGETGGGATAFSIWGVMRREELDLRLPSYLLIIVVLSYQLPALMRTFPRLVLLGLTVGLFASALGSLRFADAASADPEIASELERGVLSAAPLRLFRHWADADHDGFAARFGGGDCNDRDAAMNPAARDVPGNGIDEDCTGTDAVAAVVSAPEPAPVPKVAAPAPERLNVVLVTVDTLRFDLGFMGYERPISPNIDRLAARSTVYERAYSLASYTSKSIAPMLIGRYGCETHRGWMHFNRYPAEDVMLQERIQRAGLRTLSVQGHWYFDARSGLGRGFDVLDLSAKPAVDQAEGDKTVNSVQITDAALARLGELPADKQFYMWVHYLDPHAEYVAHPEFTFGKNQRALYDGEIAFTDAQVGRFLDGLAKMPFAERTVVVFTSDHGEAFSEHDMVRHGFELWEELVRVPLIVHVPGQAPRRYTERRSAIDLTPTILELLGLPLPSPGGDDFLRGQSLVPELIGEPLTGLPARPIFIDMQAGPYNGERQSYIHRDLKLTLSESRPSGLYDLAADPGEKQNLVKDRARLAPMLEEMNAFRGALSVVPVKRK